MGNGTKENMQKYPFAVVEGKPLPLGVTKTESGILFSVDIGGAADCTLLLFKKGEPMPCFQIEMEQGKRCGNVWYTMLAGFDCGGYEYQFLIDGKPTAGSYAKALSGGKSFGAWTAPDQIRGLFDCAEDFDWEGDKRPAYPLQEVIGYGLHVRGFTKDRSSHVRHKGTYAGIIEKLPYLTQLGVNQIELMPAYDYPEVVSLDDTHEGTGKRMNYWGYGGAYFFAPKASFAAGEDACAEFKQMVKECHRAGIEVVMEFYFPSDISGGMVLDCLRYWALAYHADGFHLNAGAVPLKEICSDPVLASCKLYADGFDGGCRSGVPTRLAVYQEQFLQTCRRLLKSDEDQLAGFTRCITTQRDNARAVNYIAGHNGFTLNDLVSYDQKHNEANGEDNRDGSNYNYSWNCGEEGVTRKTKVLKLRRQQMKNALVMLYFSQGIPMLMAGDEMGNSQQGNNNAYCQDNEISWLQWNRTSGREIQLFCQKLIAIRKAHPALHKEDAVRMMDVCGCGFPDVSFHSEKAWFMQMDAYKRHIGVMFCDGKKTKNGGFTHDILYVAYNFHWMEHDFALPKLPDKMEWALLLRTDAQEAENVSNEAEAVRTEGQRMLTVPGRTVFVLVGRKS